MFFCGCASNAPRFATPAQGYFRLKDVDRRIEAIAQVNVESKEEKVERAEFNVPTCGHIAACQRCRDRQIQSLFPTSSLFSTLKVRLRFALESLPAKTGICILPRLRVFLWLRKQRPKIRATPAQGYFRMKDVDRRIEAIAQVNVESKEEKVERAEFNVPTCGHIAVCQQCRDRQIKSLFPTSSLFSTPKVRLIEIAGLPWKACPPKQASAYVYSFDISVFLWLRKQRPKIRSTPAQGYFHLFSNERRG